MAALLVSTSAALGATLRAPTRAAVESTIRRLGTSGGPPQVVWTAGRSTPELVAGLREPTQGADLRARAQDFVSRHPELVAAGPGALEFAWEQRSARRDTVRFEQRLDGLPVLRCGLTVSLDRDGAVVSVVDETVRVLEVRRGAVAAGDAEVVAREAVARRVAGPTSVVVQPTRAWVVADAVARPVWSVRVAAPQGLQVYRVVVDAETGRALSVRDRVRR
ncbi:MAG: hypothetical protein H6744_01615 [Deltaproteobacteria bacterium]|nr:hypothetical protein [Deltaproteobacteria bacterium]